MAKQKNEGSGHYDVGYGKPPTHGRFPPGKSGNPGGRKKGSLNLKTYIERVATSEIQINDGVERSVTFFEAILLRSAQEAMRGDVKFVRIFIELCERYLVSDEAGASEELPEEDEEILSRLQRKRGNNV